MSSGKGAGVEALRKPVSCPSCVAQSQREFYPFCSKRCQDVDLHKWFAGSYAIAGCEGQDLDAET